MWKLGCNIWMIHMGDKWALVYVRQSTRDQVEYNHQSRRRQYGLVKRARHLGWAEPVVVDDDLARSGGGVARPGFERLLIAIREGRVGIVLAAEASRLARNGRDWHTLLEFADSSAACSPTRRPCTMRVCRMIVSCSP